MEAEGGERMNEHPDRIITWEQFNTFARKFYDMGNTNGFELAKIIYSQETFRNLFPDGDEGESDDE